MKSNFNKDFQEKLIRKAMKTGKTRKQAEELFKQAEFLTGIRTFLTNNK